jgi:atypical dual specificity phosphatase
MMRYYLPTYLSDNVMYYTGMARCYLQYYINNTFSASEITDRLFVGDLASACNNDAMRAQGITHIVSVFNGTVEMFPNEFKFKAIHINDDPWVDIEKYFDESNAFIEEALSTPRSKVMIHCQRGVSRSVTLMMAYLLLKMNQSKQIPQAETTQVIADVLSQIKHHRSIAEPNDGFLDSLKIFVYRLNGYVLEEGNMLTESSIDMSVSSPSCPMAITSLTSSMVQQGRIQRVWRKQKVLLKVLTGFE